MPNNLHLCISSPNSRESKEKSWKKPKEKSTSFIRGTRVRMTRDFSSETMPARWRWSEISSPTAQKPYSGVCWSRYFLLWRLMGETVKEWQRKQEQRGSNTDSNLSGHNNHVGSLLKTQIPKLLSRKTWLNKPGLGSGASPLFSFFDKQSKVI